MNNTGLGKQVYSSIRSEFGVEGKEGNTTNKPQWFMLVKDNIAIEAVITAIHLLLGECDHNETDNDNHIAQCRGPMDRATHVVVFCDKHWNFFQNEWDELHE